MYKYRGGGGFRSDTTAVSFQRIKVTVILLFCGFVSAISCLYIYLRIYIYNAM